MYEYYKIIDSGHWPDIYIYIYIYIYSWTVVIHLNMSD